MVLTFSGFRRLGCGGAPGTHAHVPRTAALTFTGVGLRGHVDRAGGFWVAYRWVSVWWVELVRTRRLLLRRWEEPDLPAFFDLYSREDVMRWLGRHPRRALVTLDEARERLHRWHALEREIDPPLGRWAIVPLGSCAQQPRPVGTIPLLPVTDTSGPTGMIEVGWHLHPQHQGRGLVTEAAAAILKAAAEAGIEQVIALTDLDNIPSQAVAARLGMRDEGVTQRWYGLTSRQYRKVITGGDCGPDVGHT